MRHNMLRIYIGYDSKEPIAYAVAAHSILRRATIPVSIAPVALKSLNGIYTRERQSNEATEFSLTRFLVPYLSNYDGFSLFMDCDMVCHVDMLQLQLAILADPGHAIWCCQHDYVPKDATKFLGQQQTTYPRKNWSSFMVFDNSRCSMLTPEYVNIATGLQLHRFHWLEQDSPLPRRLFNGDQLASDSWLSQAGHGASIGSLPLEWNWLVGEYPFNPHAKVLHYTIGTPCFGGYAQCDHSEDWWDEYTDMLSPVKWTCGWREPVVERV